MFEREGRLTEAGRRRGRHLATLVAVVVGLTWGLWPILDPTSNGGRPARIDFERSLVDRYGIDVDAARCTSRLVYPDLNDDELTALEARGIQGLAVGRWATFANSFLSCAYADQLGPPPAGTRSDG